VPEKPEQHVASYLNLYEEGSEQKEETSLCIIVGNILPAFARIKAKVRFENIAFVSLISAYFVTEIFSFLFYLLMDEGNC